MREGDVTALFGRRGVMMPAQLNLVQPHGTIADAKHDDGQAEQDKNVEPVHFRLPSTRLATKCSPIPAESQMTMESADSQIGMGALTVTCNTTAISGATAYSSRAAQLMPRRRMVAMSG